MFTLRKALWLSLVASSVLAQTPATKPKIVPAPRGWTGALRTEIHADLIVRGRITISDPTALRQAVLERGSFVDLEVQIHEVLKGRFEGEVIPLTFFAAPSDHPHKFAPSAEDMRKLIGREQILFLVRYTRRHYFLANRSAGTAVIPARPETLSLTRRRIALHAEQGEAPPQGELPELEQIRKLLDRAVKDPNNQRRAFRELEKLEREAIPALIRALDDDRELPEPRLRLKTRAGTSWTWLREYRPETVADALCCLLHEMTGETFGLDYGRPRPKLRVTERRGWNVYASYLQHDIAVARAAAFRREE